MHLDHLNPKGMLMDIKHGRMSPFFCLDTQPILKMEFLWTIHSSIKVVLPTPDPLTSDHVFTVLMTIQKKVHICFNGRNAPFLSLKHSLPAWTGWQAKQCWDLKSLLCLKHFQGRVLVSVGLTDDQRWRTQAGVPFLSVLPQPPEHRGAAALACPRRTFRRWPRLWSSQRQDLIAKSAQNRCPCWLLYRHECIYPLVLPFKNSWYKMDQE